MRAAASHTAALTLPTTERTKRMCGIVGLFAKSSAVEERLGAHLGEMLVQMSDRGPDSAGVAFYRDPAPSGASRVSLYSPDAAYDWEGLAGELRGAFGSDSQIGRASCRERV